MSVPEGPEGNADLKSGLADLLEIPPVVVGLAVGWALRDSLGFSWPMTILYAGLVGLGMWGLLVTLISRRLAQGKPSGDRMELGMAVSLLAAVTLQFGLKFLAGFSWVVSILVGIAILLLPLAFSGLKAAIEGMWRESGLTWAIGNLPPLQPNGRSDAGRSASDVSDFFRYSPSHDPRRILAVHINQGGFYPGEPLYPEKLELARFKSAGSVDRARARAHPGHAVFVANHVSARSFGGELTVVTLIKENTPPPTMADSTAFLFFGDGGLERITLVVGGGGLMVDTVARHLSDLASEMWGPPRSGSRGQKIWRVGILSLVSEEERWKSLHRAVFTWTLENLEVAGAGG